MDMNIINLKGGGFSPHSPPPVSDPVQCAMDLIVLYPLYCILYFIAHLQFFHYNFGVVVVYILYAGTRSHF